MSALTRPAALSAALVISFRALAVIATARVPIAPGWVVPVPAVLLATAALVTLALAARITLALLAGRGVLPYIAVAVTWRETGR